MESPVVSTPMEIIAKGESQVIQVDNKSMLDMVMQAIGAQHMPVFTEENCGSEGVKVSIKLDVSSAKYFVGGTTKIVLVEGSPNHSKELAEKSALLMAIKHLNERNLIEIIDYSSRIVGGIEGSEAWQYVNAASYSIEKMVEQWELSMKKCNDLAVQVLAKDAACNVEYAYEKWDLYGTLNQFMAHLVQYMSAKVTGTRAKTTDLQFKRNQYHESTTELYQARLRKGYRQVAVVQPKVILGYVLQFLGTRQASYTNTNTTHGVVKGVVEFFMPYMPGIRFCGNIQIKGMGRCSVRAEEDAALQALKFMEENYKFTVKDLNHDKRLSAEAQHKGLVKILEGIVEAAGEMEEEWGKMVKWIGDHRKDEFLSAAITVFPDESKAKHREAYSFCKEKIEALEKYVKKRYEDCSGRFEDMKGMRQKLGELMTDMDLD